MAAATMYVTPDGAGAKDGAAWASAFGEAEFENDLETASEAGDIYYIAGGTYTADSGYDWNARDGTAVAPITFVGVKAGTSNEPPTLADWADTNLDVSATEERPLFAMGANVFRSSDYNKFFNIKFTTTEASGIRCDLAVLLYNCDVVNDSGTANRNGFYLVNACTAIHCSAKSTNGYAINAAGTSVIIYCYVHDSAEGIRILGHAEICLFNIIDTCTTGINLATYDYTLLFGNSIYNTTTAVSGTDGHSVRCINNIIHTATDGFKWTTQTDSGFFAFNHNYCTDMYDGVEETVVPHKDNWVTGSSDPLFVDITGTSYTDQNYSLQAGSPCLNAGMAIKLAIGN